MIWGKAMNVLIGCECSQVVCTEFRKLGHNAFSCDIQDCYGGHPEWHIKQDVLPLLNGNCEFMSVDGQTHSIKDKWDMIIAFPPCTYFSTAGANWLFRGGKLNEERYKKGLEMKQLFMEIYNADCPRICIENVRAMKIWELPQHTQEIQPWQFGHKFSKATRIWLKNLPPLIPTDIVTPDAKWISCGYRNRELQNKAVCKAYNKKRSETFLGIAAAMAEQWG